MTDVATIIMDAYRESNIIAAGKSPSSTQTTEALRLFNRIIKAAIGNDAGETLRDWPLGNYGRQSTDRLSLTSLQIANPPINSRLLQTAEEAKTIYLPPKPSDGSRVSIADPHSLLATYNVVLDANGRTIEAANTLTLNTDGLFRDWFYRADLGDWVRVSDLVAVDDVPFPEEFDDMWTILLAIRLNPRHGRELDAQSSAVLSSLRRIFVARYLQVENLQINDDLSWPYLSVQSYENGAWGSSDEFNRGR